jgi:hypothetical protein
MLACWSFCASTDQRHRKPNRTMAESSSGLRTISGGRFDDYWIELVGDLSEQFGKLDAESIAQTEGPDYLQRRKVYAGKMMDVIDKAPDHQASTQLANLPKFFEEWQSTALAKIASDPTMTAILQLMKSHVPKFPEGSDPAITYVQPKSYAIRVAGNRVEIQPPALPPDYTTFDPLPEHDTLIPLLLKARENRAKQYPGRGLWHDAMLEIYVDNYIMLKASWEFEPSFRVGGRMTKAELTADLVSFPREPRWLQPWMDELE